MRYVHRGEPYTPAEVDEWFARQARQLRENDVCMGAMIEKATGKLIGLAGTQPLGTTGDLEIGWWLAREAWGRGHASRAGRRATRHVLGKLARPRRARLGAAATRARPAVRRCGTCWSRSGASASWRSSIRRTRPRSASPRGSACTS